MHTEADLAYMRETQELAMPGTATILGYTYTSDGQGGQTEEYAAIGTVSARLYPQTSRTYQETELGGQIVSAMKWFISMPWDTVVDARNRISMKDRTWEVVSVNNDEDWRTAIRCEVQAHNEENRT